MSENEEGTQTTAEGKSSAQTTPSSGEGQVLSQPSYVRKEDFDRAISELNDLKKQVRGVQGKTDKLESAFVNRLKALGIEVTPEMQKEILLMNLQERVEELSTQLEQRGTANPATQKTPNFANIITKAGHDPGDPRMLELAEQYADDEIGFAIEAGKLSATTPVGTGATIPAGQGNPQQDHDLLSLRKDIEEYQKAANSGNVNHARQLRREFRQKHGAAWDNINWESEDRLPL